VPAAGLTGISSTEEGSTRAREGRVKPAAGLTGMAAGVVQARVSSVQDTEA